MDCYSDPLAVGFRANKDCLLLVHASDSKTVQQNATAAPITEVKRIGREKTKVGKQKSTVDIERVLLRYMC